MHFVWYLLLLAIVLLAIPLDNLLPKSARTRTYEQIMLRNKDVRRSKPWWWLPTAWLDLPRAFAGAYVLSMAFSSDPDASAFMRKLPELISGVLLIVCSALQVLTNRNEKRCLAPLLYSAGISLALLPLSVSLSAVVLAFSSIIAIRNIAAFYLIGFGAMLGLGVLFLGKDINLLMTGVAFLAPGWMAFMLKRQLALPSRY